MIKVICRQPFITVYIYIKQVLYNSTIGQGTGIQLPAFHSQKEWGKKGMRHVV